MSKISYDCPYCRALLKEGTELCPVCGSKLNIAMLVCSHPVGNIQIGAKWNLYPRNYSIGDGKHDNIRIHAKVGEGIIKLQYDDGHFKVEVPSRDMVIKKENCYSLLIGGGMLTLHYMIENNLSEYRRAIRPVSTIALSSIYQIYSVKTLEQIYDSLLSAVLRITCLEKAYYFSVDKNMEMQMELCRSFDNVEVDQRFCEFSESVIHEAVTEENDIVCMDLHKCGNSSMSESMKNLRLKQILCIPIRNSNDILAGIVYADTQRANLMSPQLSHFKPILRILAKMAGGRIENP